MLLVDAGIAASSSSSRSQQYTTSNETFYTTDAKKMANDRGLIRSVVSEKNPKGMTMVRFVALHQDSGVEIDADHYLYPIDPNGWLIKDYVSVYKSRTKMLNSGTYYLKSDSNEGKFYTSGTLTLLRGVTNVVTIEMR